MSETECVCGRPCLCEPSQWGDVIKRAAPAKRPRSVLSLEMDSGDLEQLSELAEQAAVSLTEMARRAIRYYIDWRIWIGDMTSVNTLGPVTITFPTQTSLGLTPTPAELTVTTDHIERKYRTQIRSLPHSLPMDPESEPDKRTDRDALRRFENHSEHCKHTGGAPEIEWEGHS